jgi:hypothetical protein
LGHPIVQIASPPDGSVVGRRVYVQTDSKEFARLARLVEGVGTVQDETVTGGVWRLFITPTKGTTAEQLSAAIKARLDEEIARRKS